MTRPPIADDFATIRARMKELRLERERLEWDPPMHRDRSKRWPSPEISEEPGRVHQPGSGTPLDRDRAWSARRG